MLSRACCKTTGLTISGCVCMLKIPEFDCLSVPCMCPILFIICLPSKSIFPRNLVSNYLVDLFSDFIFGHVPFQVYDFTKSSFLHSANDLIFTHKLILWSCVLSNICVPLTFLAKNL